MYLSGRCLRQRAIDKELWDLETRQPRLAKGDDLLVVGLRGAGLEFEEGARRLAPFRVGTSHDGRQHDRRVLRQHLFHLKARNIFAAGDDDVLGAILDLDRTVRMPNGEVTGEAPISDQRLCRCSFVFEVSLHHGIAAHHDLADASCHRAEPEPSSWDQRP